MVAFERHLDEQVDFSVTIYDRNDVRQSVSGVTDLRLTIYRQSDLTAIISADHTHCIIEETTPETAGDVRYSAPPGTITDRGRYLCKFLATIGGVPVAFPEKGFIALVIT